MPALRQVGDSDDYVIPNKHTHDEHAWIYAHADCHDEKQTDRINESAA